MGVSSSLRLFGGLPATGAIARTFPLTKRQLDVAYRSGDDLMEAGFTAPQVRQLEDTLRRALREGEQSGIAEYSYAALVAELDARQQ